MTSTHREQRQGSTSRNGAECADHEDQNVHVVGIPIQSNEPHLDLRRIQLFLENVLFMLRQMRKERIVV